MSKRVNWDAAKKAEVIQRLTSGESVASIFRDPKLPSRQAFYLEQAKDEEFFTLIARARKTGIRAQFDDFLDLADQADPENFNAVKVKLWARTWVLSRLDPALYGDKQQVELSGSVDLAGRLDAARKRAGEPKK